jgi:hypothetical protein
MYGLHSSTALVVAADTRSQWIRELFIIATLAKRRRRVCEAHPPYVTSRRRRPGFATDANCQIVTPGVHPARPPHARESR